MYFLTGITMCGLRLISFAVAALVNIFAVNTVINVDAEPQISKSPANFTIANGSCTLAPIDDISLTEKKTVWLPIYKQEYKNWMTVDNTYFADAIVPKSTRISGQDCAVLRSEDRIIDEIFCRDKPDGFICHDKEKGKCIDHGDCLTLYNYNVTIFYKRVSWFAAYAKCKSKATELLTLDKSTLDIITKTMWQKVQHQGAFAVGIIRSAWQLSNDKSAMLENYSWADNEPSPEGHCAVMDNETRMWRVENCSKTHHFICKIKGFTKQVTQGDLWMDFSTTTSEPHTKNATHKAEGKILESRYVKVILWIIMLPVLLLCLLVFLCLICKLFIKRRRLKKRACNVSHLEEAIPLIERMEGTGSSSETNRKTYLKSARLLAIQNNRSLLHETIQIEGSDLLQRMEEREILSEANSSFIKESKANKVMVERLLDIMLRKNDESYNQFCDCLWEAKQKDVVKHFLYTEDDLCRAKEKIPNFIKNEFQDIPLYSMAEVLQHVPLQKIYVNTCLKHCGPEHEQSTLDSHEELVKQMQANVGNRIIISGATGAGKTSLVKQLANEWADSKMDGLSNNLSPYSFYILLLPIILRYIKKHMDIVDMLKDQFQVLSYLEAYALSCAMETYMEKVLVILDGYDELEAHNIIDQIIGKHLFPKASLIVTTRPHGITQLKKLHGTPPEKLFHIHGFHEKQIEKYISLFFSLNDQCCDDGNLLYKEIMDAPSYILDMAKTPIQLMIMCIVWKCKKFVANKIINLYESFVDCLEIHMKEKDASMDCKPVLLALSCLANSWTKHGALNRIFSYSELANNFSTKFDGMIKLGCLMKVSPLQSHILSNWSFTHLTLQEYFLARYIAECASVDENTLKMFSTIQRLERLETTLIFLCGVNPSSLNQILKPVIMTTTDRQECHRLLLLLLKLIPEYQSLRVLNLPLPSFVDSATIFGITKPTKSTEVKMYGELSNRTWLRRGSKDFSKSLDTPFEIKKKLKATPIQKESEQKSRDLEALSHLSLSDRRIEHRNMQNLTLSDTAMNCLCTNPQLLDITYATMIELKHVRYDASGVKIVNKLLKRALCLTTLDMSEIEGIHTEENLVTSLWKTLKQLKLHGDHVIEIAVNEVPHFENVHTLVLEDKNPTQACLNKLCMALIKTQTIQCLHMTISQLTTALLKLSEQIKVFLTVQTIDSASISNFVAEMTESQTTLNLEELRINRINLPSERDVENMMFFLLHTIGLKKLGIGEKYSQGKINTDIAEPGESGNIPSMLNVLSFSYVNLSGKENVLKRILKYSPHLTVLMFDNCHLRKEEVLQMSSSLPQSSSISSIQLTQNSELKEDGMVVGSFLQETENLSLLDLGNCLINIPDLLLKWDKLTNVKYLDLRLSYDEHLLICNGLTFMIFLQALSIADCRCSSIHDLLRLLVTLPQSVTHLNVCNNDFGPDVVNVTREKQKLAQLQKLNIGMPHQIDEVESIRHELLEENPDLQVYNDKEERLWSMYFK